MAANSACSTAESAADSGSRSDALTLARGTGANLVGFVGRICLAFLHSFVAARLFGAELYGLYAEADAGVNLLGAVGQLGMQRTITRFVALYRARGQPREAVRTLRIALTLSLPLSVALALAMGLGAEPVARLFGDATAASTFRVMGLALPTFNLGLLLGSFTQGLKQMRPKVLALDLLGPGLEFALAAALAMVGLRQIGLPAAYLLASACSAGLLTIMAVGRARRLTQEAVQRTGRPVRVGEILRFAFPVLARDLLLQAGSRVNILILGLLGGSAMVGVFSILNRLVSAANTFTVSIAGMFSPMAADLSERREPGRLAHLYKASTRWSLSISLPALVTVAFFSTEILRLFGRDFAAGSVALRFLAAAQVVNVGTGLCGELLAMAGYPQYGTINQAVLLATTSGLSLLLIPRYGLLGAVWAWATGIVVTNTLRVLEVWLRLRMHPYSPPLWKVAFATAAMSLSLGLWRAFVSHGRPIWYLLLPGTAAGLAVYALVLLALGLEADERDLLHLARRRAARLLARGA